MAVLRSAALEDYQYKCSVIVPAPRVRETYATSTSLEISPHHSTNEQVVQTITIITATIKPQFHTASQVLIDSLSVQQS